MIQDGSIGLGSHAAADAESNAIGGEATSAGDASRRQRIYVVGDIHGRLEMLEDVLALIRRDNDARPSAPTKLVLLGNIVDYGEETAIVVDLCTRFSARSADFVVLKGAHEALMVAALRGDLDALALWLAEGGRQTLASWGLGGASLDELTPVEQLAAARRVVPPEVIFWLDALPRSHREGRYRFRHGSLGSRAGAPLDARVLPLVCSDVRLGRALPWRIGVRCRFSRVRSEGMSECAIRSAAAAVPPPAIRLERGRSWPLGGT